MAHDDDRLRLPPVPSPQTSEAGKDNQRTTASTKLAGRPSRHRGAHRPTATAAMPHTAENRSARARSVNKSAKSSARAFSG